VKLDEAVVSQMYAYNAPGSLVYRNVCVFKGHVSGIGRGAEASADEEDDGVPIAERYTRLLSFASPIRICRLLSQQLKSIYPLGQE